MFDVFQLYNYDKIKLKEYYENLHQEENIIDENDEIIRPAASEVGFWRIKEKNVLERWVRIAEPTEASPDTFKVYLAKEPNDFKANW